MHWIKSLISRRPSAEREAAAKLHAAINVEARRADLFGGEKIPDTLDGRAVAYQRSFDMETGARMWMVLSEGPEPEVDQSISRQRGFDPDLWVVEVEDREGRHLLDEPGLAD